MERFRSNLLPLPERVKGEASKPVMKGSRVESIEDARKEYKKLLEEGWKKTSIFNSHF